MVFILLLSQQNNQTTSHQRGNERKAIFNRKTEKGQKVAKKINLIEKNLKF
jgi:hypothetical protein